MKYARLSTTHRSDHKIQQLTNGQRLLFIDLICWSTLHETDGRVPSSALPDIVKGHQRWAAGLLRMIEVGLLQNEAQGDHSAITLASLSHHSHITLLITSFDRWQMVHTNEGAGQALSDGPSSRARTPAGTPARTEPRPDPKGINNKDQVQQAPARLIDGEWYKHIAGSGWVKDHGRSSDEASRQAGQGEP